MALTEKRIKELEDMLAAFPFSLLQDFITFTKHCERLDIDADEIPDFVRHFIGDVARVQARQSRDFARQYEEKASRCTICNSILIIEDINDRKSRMIDKHSKSWMICPNRMCEFDPIMSDKYPYEILSDLGIQVHQKSKESLPSTAKRQKAAANQRLSGKRRQQT